MMSRSAERSRVLNECVSLLRIADTKSNMKRSADMHRMRASGRAARKAWAMACIRCVLP